MLGVLDRSALFEHKATLVNYSVVEIDSVTKEFTHIERTNKSGINNETLTPYTIQNRTIRLRSHVHGIRIVRKIRIFFIFEANSGAFGIRRTNRSAANVESSVSHLCA
jgi:hypothetical protein